MTDLDTEDTIMGALAAMLNDILNGERVPGENPTVFALIVLTPGAIGGSHVNWVTNGERADLVKTMKDLVARCEAQDAMKAAGGGKAVLQ